MSFQRHQTAPSSSFAGKVPAAAAASRRGQQYSAYPQNTAAAAVAPAAQSTSSSNSSSTSNRIDVVVRCRPFLRKEILAAEKLQEQQGVLQPTGPESTVTCLTDTVIVDPSVAKRHNTSRYLGMKGNVKVPKRFGFDAVLGPRSTQTEVYSSAIRKIALDTFNGRNGSVLAYGATGSGKTHTMLGTPEEPGIIFQAMQDILRQRDAFECMGKRVSVKVAHYEIYNELVHDLLVPHQPHHQHCNHHQSSNQHQHHFGQPQCATVKRTVLQVQETADGAADIPHLKWCYPETMDDFNDLINLSLSNRAVGETAANETSSRSHAILTIEVEIRNGTNDTAVDDSFGDEESNVGGGTVARLKLCDLAGSERAAANRGEKKTFKEGANINKSLLALGAVVQALATNKGGGKFIPYRGSKLTRLLKDCLGGNCNTVMMVCITGHPNALDETNNTLQYAMYAKKIEAQVKTNDFNDRRGDTLRKELQREIDRLQQENDALKEELKSGYGGGMQQQLGGTQQHHVSPRIRHSGNTTTSGGTMVTKVDVSTDCFDLESGGRGASFSNAFFEAFTQLSRQYNELIKQRLELLDDLQGCSEYMDGIAASKLRGHRIKLEQLKCGTAPPSYSSSSTKNHASSNPRHVQVEGPPSAQVAREEHMISVYLKQLDDNARCRKEIQAKMSDVDEKMQRLFEMITCKELDPFNKLLHKGAQFRFDAYQAQMDLTALQKKNEEESQQRAVERDLALDKSTEALNALFTIPHRSQEMQLIGLRAKEALIFNQVPDIPETSPAVELERRVSPVTNHLREAFKKLPSVRHQLKLLLQQQQLEADCDAMQITDGTTNAAAGVDPNESSVNSSSSNNFTRNNTWNSTNGGTGGGPSSSSSHPSSSTSKGFRQRYRDPNVLSSSAAASSSSTKRDPHAFIASLSGASNHHHNASPTPMMKWEMERKQNYQAAASGKHFAPDPAPKRGGGSDQGGSSSSNHNHAFHRSATSASSLGGGPHRSGKENSRVNFR